MTHTDVNTKRSLHKTVSAPAETFGPVRRSELETQPLFESTADELERIKSYSPVKERELAPYASTQNAFDSPSRGSVKSMTLDGFDIDDDFKVEPFDASSSSPRKRGRDATPDADEMAVDDEGTDVEDDMMASPSRRSALRSHHSSNRSLGRSQTAPATTLAFDAAF